MSEIKPGDRILATDFNGVKHRTIARSAPYMGHSMMVIDIEPLGRWEGWPADAVELDPDPYASEGTNT